MIAMVCLFLTNQPAEASTVLDKAKYVGSVVSLPIRIGQGVVRGVKEGFHLWVHFDLMYCKVCGLHR